MPTVISLDYMLSDSLLGSVSGWCCLEDEDDEVN